MNINATIRYPDGDPVKGETVLAVAYSPDLRQIRALTLTEAGGESGVWRGNLPAVPGRWQIEVDAVLKTKGLQSIGFLVRQDGTIAEVSSPSPLPATVPFPGAPAEAAGSGLREAPRTSPTGSQLILGLTLVVIGLVVALLIFRRLMAESERPRLSSSQDSA